MRLRQNYLLTEGLASDLIPKGWELYIIRKDTALSQWLPDFERRLDQLQRYARNELLVTDLGLLFQPSGYITATRQSVAQRTGLPLEELKLRMEFGSKQVDDGFEIAGEPGRYRCRQDKADSMRA
jgi:dynein heavy chain 1